MLGQCNNVQERWKTNDKYVDPVMLRGMRCMCVRGVCGVPVSPGAFALNALALVKMECPAITNRHHR